ncbi:MAG: hypothetical protein MOB07_29660 [Acidobacteria bacterium]|nr:hypothetical protein [Acidobacteriota bacterium]
MILTRRREIELREPQDVVFESSRTERHVRALTVSITVMAYAETIGGLGVAIAGGDTQMILNGGRWKLQDVPSGIHMSIMSLTGNQTTGFAPDPLRRKRNRLRNSALVTGLILFASGVIGVAGWHRQRSSPRPDYYMLFLTDLAEQHYRLTGTVTVVRENERALDYLNRLYGRKARRDRRPEEMASVSHNGVLHFSFVPGAIGWQEYPFAYLAEKQMAPSMTFTEPSGEPLALWVFSRSERALAVIFAEQPVVDDLVNPGPRIIETVNRSGAAAAMGDFKPAEVALAQAYLLPLDKLRLDAPGEWAGNAATLEQVAGSVPLLFGVGAESATGQTRLDAGQSLARLEAAAPPIFFTLAWATRWIVFPVALLMAWTLFRLRKVRREWNGSLSRAVPEDRAVLHFGFFRFLTADLVVEVERLLAETADQRREEASRRQEQSRRERFETEMRDCLGMLARLGQGSPCDEGWLTEASTAELEEMAAHCHRLVERHREQVEREGQAARERARQIYWLEGEFAAVPPEKRAEAASAFALYEQACAASDPGKRLEMLKAARKLLPKEFKGE